MNSCMICTESGSFSKNLLEALRRKGEKGAK